MAFAHLRGRRHRPLELLLRRLGMDREADGHIGEKALAERASVDARAVAGDHPGALQILHATQAGGGREADPFGQGEIADPPVAGQFLQYPVGDAVQTRHGLQDSLGNAKDCNLWRCKTA
jgi:hypothetical protein